MDLVMDYSSIGFTFAICLVISGISYADRTIQVADDTCNSTHIFSTWETITLRYEPNRPFQEDGHTFKECIFKFRNDNPGQVICIKNGRDSFEQLYVCGRVFRYYTGSISRGINDKGRTCSNFHYFSSCTEQSTVFALFNNDLAYNLFNLTIKVFTIQQRVVVTTRRVITTTRRWYYEDDTKSYEEGFGEKISKVVVKLVIVAIVVMLTFCICSVCLRRRASENTGQIDLNDQYSQHGYQEEPRYQQQQERYTDPQFMQQTPETRFVISLMTTNINSNADDAPPYITVMENPDIYSREEEDKNRHTPSPVTPTAPELHQPPNDDPPGTNMSFQEQNIPIIPPPDYSDLPPPPPYPGT